MAVFLGACVFHVGLPSSSECMVMCPLSLNCHNLGATVLIVLHVSVFTSTRLCLCLHCVHAFQGGFLCSWRRGCSLCMSGLTNICGSLSRVHMDFDSSGNRGRLNPQHVCVNCDKRTVSIQMMGR